MSCLFMFLFSSNLGQTRDVENSKMVGASRKTDWDSPSCWTLGTGFRKMEAAGAGISTLPHASHLVLIGGLPPFCAPQENFRGSPTLYFCSNQAELSYPTVPRGLGEHIYDLMLPHGHPGSRKVRTPVTWVRRASDLPGCSASSNVDKEFREPDPCCYSVTAQHGHALPLDEELQATSGCRKRKHGSGYSWLEAVPRPEVQRETPW